MLPIILHPLLVYSPICFEFILQTPTIISQVQNIFQCDHQYTPQISYLMLDTSQPEYGVKPNYITCLTLNLVFFYVWIPCAFFGRSHYGQQFFVLHPIIPHIHLMDLFHLDSSQYPTCLYPLECFPKSSSGVETISASRIALYFC